MRKEPVLILEQCKDIYLKKSEKETGCSVEDIIEIYNIGVKMLNKLKLLRDNKQKTIRYLKVKSKRNCYKCNTILLETWLIQSMVEDDTYLYAYNYLSQISNRQEGFDMFKIKLLSDFDLLNLLKSESSDQPVKLGKENLSISILNKELLYQQNKKYRGKDYALTFILDCYANGENPNLYSGRKKELENLGNSLIGVGRGNTFYQCFNKILNDVNGACLKYESSQFSRKIESIVNNSDWKEVVIYLSKDKDKINKYLIDKKI